MGYVKGTFHTRIAQQAGHIQLLIIAPILTLCLLGLIVRGASSAVDHRIEKQKVAAQLKQRLSEVHNDLNPPPFSRSADVLVPAPEPVDELPPELQELMDEPPSLAEPDADQPEIVAVATPDEQRSQPQSFPFQTTHKVRKNDTFETILRGQGLRREESGRWIAAWITAAKKERQLRKLQIGQRFSFDFAKSPEAPLLTSLSYEMSPLSWLILERAEDGSVTSRTEKLPTTVVWRATAGRITSSLYEAAVNQAGVPEGIVDKMVDLGWDLDFFSDLRAGDTFKVIFEEHQRDDGEPVQYGRVLAAEIVNKGKVLQVLLPTQDQGFLYPLRFTRISSVFTTARFHPILKRRRPHNGVDFAAPRGTLVRAVADGKVIYAGRKGGFGRLVRIDHPGPYRTEYAHLHRIAKGIRVGKRVERGQKIGRVGSTGLATGPHLHFGLLKYGRYVNPLKNLSSIVPKADTQKSDPDQIKLKKTLTQYLAQLEIGQTSETQVFAAVKPATAEPTNQPRS